MASTEERIYTIHVISSIDAGNNEFVKSVVWDGVIGETGIRPLPVGDGLRQKQQEGTVTPYGYFMSDNDIVNVHGMYLIGVSEVRSIAGELDYIQRKMSGLILLLDSRNPETFKEAKDLLASLLNKRNVPCTILANWLDDPLAVSIDEIRAQFSPEFAEVHACNVLDKAFNKTIVANLLARIRS